MYPRAGESIIMRTVCPQSNMEMVLRAGENTIFKNNIQNTIQEWFTPCSRQHMSTICQLIYAIGVLTYAMLG